MHTYNIEGIIIPGKSVGEFQIGWTKNELFSRNLIDRDYTNQYMPESCIHEKNRNIVIHINENNIIQEIVAMNNYKGKVNGIFGIGDCLKDFRDQIKYETSEYDSEGYFYFPDIPGLRLLAERWNEDGSKPIESISIFDPELGYVF